MQSGVKEEQLQELNLLGLLICRETPGPVQAETETYRFSYSILSDSYTSNLMQFAVKGHEELESLLMWALRDQDSTGLYRPIESKFALLKDTESVAKAKAGPAKPSAFDVKIFETDELLRRRAVAVKQI